MWSSSPKAFVTDSHSSVVTCMVATAADSVFGEVKFASFCTLLPKSAFWGVSDSAAELDTVDSFSVVGRFQVGSHKEVI